MKRNMFAGFLCTVLSFCIAMSNLPVFASKDLSRVYAAESAAEEGSNEVQETEEKMAQEAENKAMPESAEIKDSETQALEQESESSTDTKETGETEEKTVQESESESTSETQEDMPEESSNAEINNGASDSGFPELEELLGKLKKKYTNMYINSDGYFEYADENGKAHTYDPYDPELFKYLLRDETALEEDDDALIQPYENSAGDTQSPFTSGRYSHESHVSDKIVRHGIDVSKYQEEIDWKKAKNAGVYFAFVRVGYRGYGTDENGGKISKDEYAVKNIKAAYDAGVKVGVYFFSQAITEPEAKEEADYTIKFLKDNGFENKISLPIMIDYEYVSKGRLEAANFQDKKLAHQNICDRFVKAVRDNGFKGGIYANYNMLTKDMQPKSSSLYSSTEYWIARYDTRTGYANNYTFWQYSSKGKVDGIPKNADGIPRNVDCNFWYQDKISIAKCRISFVDNAETDYVADVREALSIYDTANKRDLVEDKDYSVTVTERQVKEETGGTEKTVYDFVITGKSDYTGKAERTGISIMSTHALSAAMISDIAPQEYTGLAITQETGLKFDIYNGQAKLAEGTDYTVSYLNNIETGTGKVVVEGMGNYTGKVEKTFTIKPKDLTADMFEDIPDAVYTGANQTTATGIKIKGTNKNIEYELKENTDYSVKYSSNKNAGKAKAILAGRGKYAGSVTLEFNIAPYDFSNDANVRLKYEEMAYTGKALKPSVTVMLGSRKLSSSDYTLVYGDNVSIGEHAFVTVKGKRNYTGEAKKEFKITPKPIKPIKLTSKMVSLKNTHMYINDNGEPVKPEIYVINGTNLLEEGKDYTITYLSKSGAKLDELTKAGEYKIVVTGDDAYAGKVTKNITLAEKDLKYAEVTITSAPETLVYTGKAVTAGINVKDKINGRQLTEGAEYKVSYIDNKNAGKARVVIKGKGEYKGEVIEAFDILPKNVADPEVKLNKDLFVYNGKKQQPKITVKGGRTSLKLNRDFALQFIYNTADPENAQDAADAECKDAGKYTVNIKLIGNYSGTVTAAYEITKADFGKVKASVKNQNYTGTNVCPTFDDMTVKLGSVVLDENALSGVTLGGWQSNTSVGTAEFEIKASAECRNFEKGSNTFRFKIVKRQMKDLGITLGGAAVSDTNKCDLALVYNDGAEYRPAVAVNDVQAGKTLVENTDYRIAFSNNKNAGNAKAVISGIGSYSGSRTIYFKIAGKPIDEDAFSIKFKDADKNGNAGSIYNGTEYKPTVYFEYGNKRLINGKDYTVKYKNNINAGDAWAVVTGKGNYSGTMSKKFYIFEKEKKPASKITVSSIPDQKYTGNKIVPNFTVTFDGAALVKGKDYTVSVLNSTKLTYTQNKKRKGTATVIITGIGNYKGTLAKSSFTVYEQ